MGLLVDIRTEIEQHNQALERGHTLGCVECHAKYMAAIKKHLKELDVPARKRAEVEADLLIQTDMETFYHAQAIQFAERRKKALGIANEARIAAQELRKELENV